MTGIGGFRRLVHLGTCSLVLAAVFVNVPAAGAQRSSGGQGRQYVLAMNMILSGELRSIGDAIENGAELATIQRSRTDLARLGVGVSLDAMDYGANGTYSPAKGAANARKLIANPRVFAEDGPYNSGVAAVTMPIYNRADMVQLSPANTLPDLTYPSNLAKYQPATAAGKHGRTYFRDCTTDAFQGPAGADFAKAHFHTRTGYVVNDWGLPGIGLANAYQRFLPTIGIKVLGRSALQQSDPTGSAARAAAAIAKVHPDAVFFGGEPDTGGAIFADALRKAGVHVPIIGGDALYSGGWIVGTNGQYHPGSQNSWMTVIGPSPLHDPHDRQFLANYRAHFHHDPTPFAALAYDAANIEIDGLVQALQEGKGSNVHALREAVRSYVQHVHYTGLVGKISFNKNGDTNDKVIGMWHVTGKTPTSFSWLGYVPGFAPKY